MTVKTHRNIIASIFFVLGVLNLLGWVAVGGWHHNLWMFLAFAVFQIVTGIKIHNNTPGAKVFGIVASLLAIPSFPIGTAIGVYGLWVLLMSDKS